MKDWEKKKIDASSAMFSRFLKPDFTVPREDICLMSVYGYWLSVNLNCKFL